MKKLDEIENVHKLKRPTLVDTGLPGWLQPYKQDTSNFHTEATLEKALTLLESGISIRSICRDHPDMPRPEILYKWFRSTPEWEARYMEAKRVGAEMLIDETIDIAAGLNSEGENNMEDTQRSALRIKNAQWLAAKFDPDRFGDKKQIDINQNINLNAAIDEGLKRVEHGRTIDVMPD